MIFVRSCIDQFVREQAKKSLFQLFLCTRKSIKTYVNQCTKVAGPFFRRDVIINFIVYRAIKWCVIWFKLKHALPVGYFC